MNTNTTIMKDNTVPRYTPGVQAGEYETADACNVEQEVRELNSLQADGDKESSIVDNGYTDCVRDRQKTPQA